MVRVKDIRLKNNDYRNGWYFITIVCNYRKPLLIEYRSLIEKEISEVKKIAGCELDYYVVMPDHVHLVLGLGNSGVAVGEIIRRFKARTSKEAKQKLWQPNFYEHGIRTEEALNKIREYIQNNPETELLKFDQFYR